VRRRLAALFLFVVVIAGACSQSSSSQGNELVLGAIYPLSGPQAEGGKEELAGVKAALKLAQTSGALKVRVRLVVVDAQGRVIASFPDQGRLVMFGPDGQQLKEIPTQDNSSPVGVAVAKGRERQIETVFN